MTKIKNVVFDLGRVIYNFWPRQDLLNLGFSEQRADEIMASVFNDPLWIECDKGLMMKDDVRAVIREKHPHLVQDMEVAFDETWVNRVITIMPESLEFFHDVKRRGFDVYILSNFPKESFEEVRARDSFFGEVKGMVISCYEHLIKPDLAIYQRLLTRYKLSPHETIFIDDLAANIAAAESLGIKGIIFTDLADCKRQFEELIK